MSVVLNVTCPEHGVPFVVNKAKPHLLGKCLWRLCPFGILKSDPQKIQDISSVNDWHAEG
jgi:hypothetical protein